ncbi:MAG: hypothetical protein GY851_23110, partial [bacterium]|nr:hypothetical protein [bacterium]
MMGVACMVLSLAGLAHAQPYTFFLLPEFYGSDYGGTHSPFYEIFPAGTVLSVTATPSPGWVFSHWVGDAGGSANPLSLVMDSQKRLGAMFDTRFLNVQAETDEGGWLEPEDVEIAITPPGYPYSNVYIWDPLRVWYPNTTVTIEAKPEPGWEFVEWRGAVTGTDNPISLQLEGGFQEAFEVTAVCRSTDDALRFRHDVTGRGDWEDVVGVCADGKAEIRIEALVEAGVDKEQVQLDIDEVGDNGTFSNGEDSSTAERIEERDGQHFAIFTYTAPLEFVRDPVYPTTDREVMEREIPFRLTINDQDRSASPALRLARPPVVFLHGLWSDNGIWRQMDQSLASTYKFRYAHNYNKTSGRPLVENSGVPVRA